MCEIKLRQVTESDLDRCFEIERDSYEGDAAATRNKIYRRICEYPEGFIVLERDGVVVGFISCGATDRVDLADEGFKDLVGHDPKGRHIVIFSVVVHRKYQGQGLAGKLMVDFISRIRGMHKKSIHLLCRSRLVAFYEKYGFEDIGRSKSTHGGLNWHEMVLHL